jgi:alkylation response protein AidB-like acyl-CoA dehydrogenase
MVDRGYRDSRINRIFEGTNEINRLLVVDTAMKRAMKGDFPLFGEAEKLWADVQSISNGKNAGESYFEEKYRYIENFKKAILLCMHGASAAFKKTIVSEQETLNNIADMMMAAYISESLALRIEKMEKVKGGDLSLYKDMLDVNIRDAADMVRKSALDAAGSFCTPDNCEPLVKAIEALTETSCVNVKEARRRIADRLIADNSYKF